MDTSSSCVNFLENLCRTCMSGHVEVEKGTEGNQYKMFSIFAVPERLECKSITIMELLMLTAPQLNIKSDDMLPKTLCENCVERLLDAYEFQRMCITVKTQLLQILKDQQPENTQTANNLIDKKSVNQAIIEITNMKVETDEILIDHLESSTFSNRNKSFFQENQCEEDYSDSDEFCDIKCEEDNDWETPSNVTKSSQSIAKKLEEEKEISSSSPKNDKGNVDKNDETPPEASEESNKTANVTNTSKDNLNKKNTCDVCGKQLATGYSLKRHKRIHLDPKANECKVCEKVFKNVSALKQHMKTHAKDKGYLCSECGKTFKTLYLLRMHFLRHGADRPHVCQYCPKRFRCRSDLSSHKVVHNKVKPHVCDICGSRFMQLHMLRTHKMSHAVEKNHKCNYCDKRFVKAAACRVHMRTHTGEKPYKCKFCERAFAQSGDLIKHMRLDIGDNVYRCDLCPQGFRLLADLRLHLCTHKDDDEGTKARNLQPLKKEDTDFN